MCLGTHKKILHPPALLLPFRRATRDDGGSTELPQWTQLARILKSNNKLDRKTFGLCGKGDFYSLKTRDENGSI